MTNDPACGTATPLPGFNSPAPSLSDIQHRAGMLETLLQVGDLAAHENAELVDKLPALTRIASEMAGQIHDALDAAVNPGIGK